MLPDKQILESELLVTQVQVYGTRRSPYRAVWRVRQQRLRLAEHVNGRWEWLELRPGQVCDVRVHNVSRADVELQLTTVEGAVHRRRAGIPAETAFIALELRAALALPPLRKPRRAASGTISSRPRATVRSYNS